MLRNISRLLIAGFIVLLVNINAHATLLGYNTCIGANECLIAPNDITIPNPIVANPNNGLLIGWDEIQNVTLASDLRVGRVADPMASFVGQDSSGYFIQAGTIVASHYFQWDPGNQSSARVQAQLSFDSEIFAFITSDSDLFASDAALGLAGYDYTDFRLRGLEPRDRTDFSPSGDNRLVDINWRASSPGDWTRLITAFSPAATPPDITIPEPSSIILLGIGLIGIGFSLRGRAKRPVKGSAFAKQEDALALAI